MKPSVVLFPNKPLVNILTQCTGCASIAVMTLELWMQQHNKSVDDVASAIGVTGRAVRHYLSGDRRPDWTIISRIADMTSNAVTANDFLEKQKKNAPLRAAV